MEFCRQEYWSGLPFPSPGDLPDPGIEPGNYWDLFALCSLLRFLHLNIFVLPLQSRESWENVLGQVHVLYAVNWENCARPVFSVSLLHLVLEIRCSFPPGTGHTPLPRVSWPASWKKVRESFPHLLFLTFLPLKIFSLPRCCVWGWHVLNPVSSREEPPLAMLLLSSSLVSPSQTSLLSILLPLFCTRWKESMSWDGSQCQSCLGSCVPSTPGWNSEYTSHRTIVILCMRYLVHYGLTKPF